MPTRLIAAIALLPFLLALTALAADPPTAPTVISGSLAKKTDSIAHLPDTLGHDGILFIRSQDRWDQLNKLLPNLSPDTPLPKLDFAKQSVIMLYTLPCRETDTFSLDSSNLAAKTPQLDFLLHWDNRPREQEDRNSAHFILAIIPAAPAVKITFSIQALIVAGALPSPLISTTLGGPEGGDIVDGLQASIAAKATTIKPGDDILLDFALHAPKLSRFDLPVFAMGNGKTSVWDGKYSNGYRNHAFLVTTPDGKTTLLQPKLITEWDKNAPHPVEITAAEPYHLPNWADGDNLKALKALGLDTTTPGAYIITGLYQEIEKHHNPFEQGPLWSGSITTNTITIHVKQNP